MKLTFCRRNLLILILVGFGLAACGRGSAQVKGHDIDLMAGPTTSGISAETRYASLDGSEISVTVMDLNGNPLLGSSVLHRESTLANVFCRKQSAVVQNPTYSYHCWLQVTPSTADANQFAALAGHTLIQMGGTVGTQVEESVDADSKNLCQKTTAVTLGATPAYQCFKAI